MKVSTISIKLQTHRSRIWLIAQSDAVLLEFLPKKHLELNPRYPDEFRLALFVLIQVPREFLSTPGTGGSRGTPAEDVLVGHPPGGRSRRPRTGTVTLALFLDGLRLLQGEVDGSGSLLAQSPHRLQETVPVLGVEDSDRVQVGVPHLFTNLQIVVAIVQEGLGVLAEVERPQPFDDDVAVARHGDVHTRITRVHNTITRHETV